MLFNIPQCTVWPPPRRMNDQIPTVEQCPGWELWDNDQLPMLGSFWLSHMSVGPPTWNWALMLGGFFFLCRCSSDLVVRSCRVILMMSFRDLESSRF